MASEQPSFDTVFCAAIEISSGEERAAYIARACGDNNELRDRVERLVAAHFQAGSFMESPAEVRHSPQEADDQRGRSLAATSADAHADRPGTVIGPYKLLEQIGEGGFGVVFMAEQTQPVRRKVALKILKPGMDTRQVVARFEAERQALAIMDHPNIAKVLDGGATTSGRQFFVMDLVKGVPITEHCDQNHLKPRERLELFVAVCHAVQHAHQKGIIHRDLKPSNVLVTMHDTTPIVKVIDFGVAKALGQELTDKTLFTGFAQMIGTPMYMSPEQAGQSSLDIDTRSDIYSLGVLLYELLTGTTPFDKERFKQAAYDEIRRIIREEEPPKPSTRLSSTNVLPSIAANRGLEPTKLSGQVRGELDWIVMKALEKDRSRRYETSNGLALDVERYLNDEPVQAGPPSAWYRFRKAARRHKAALTSAMFVAAALLIGATVAFWQAVRATHAERDSLAAAAAEAKARAVADVQRDKAIKANEAASAALQREVEARSSESQQRRWAEENSLRATQLLYAAHINLAQNAWENAQIGRVRELLDQYNPDRTAGPDLRGFEWHFLQRLCRPELRSLTGHALRVNSVAFSPDGRRVVSRGAEFRRPGEVKVWDAATGRELLALAGDSGQLARVTISPDGKRIASPGGPPGPAAVTVWDAASGQGLLKLAGHTTDVICVAFSSDNTRIATGSMDSTARVWDAATGKEIHTLRGHKGHVMAVAFSPDGTSIASAASNDSTVRVWAAETGEPTLTLPVSPAGASGVAFSPDGARLAVARSDSQISVWRTAARHEELDEPLALRGHRGRVTSVAFSSDGKRIASAGMDQTVRLWDSATGENVLTLHGHAGPVNSVAFSPDGRQIVSGGGAFGEPELKIWDSAAEPGVVTLRGHRLAVVAVAHSPDGRRVASVGSDMTVKVWDVSTGYEVLDLLGHTMPLCSVAFSPDGNRVASAGGTPRKEAEIKVWATTTGNEILNLSGPVGCVSSVAFSPDGQRLAATVGQRDKDAVVKLWDAHSGKELLSLDGFTGYPATIAFSPDGRRIAGAGGGNSLRVWDSTTGDQLLTLRGHSSEVVGVAFGPDGRQLASTSYDGTVKVWDAAAGNETHTLRGHAGIVRTVVFSPDGRRLASSGDDKTIKLWDCATGQELITLSGHTGSVHSVSFSSDGWRLASAGDSTVRLWDATPMTAELLLQREARSVVEFYRAKLPAIDDVRDAVRNDTTISEQVRERTLTWLKTIRTDDDN
jgi:WD40 repeat protein/serine/threonine protein kinase